MEKISPKKTLFNILKPYFIEKGYKYFINIGANIFVKIVDDNYVIHFHFNIFQNGGPYFSRFKISHFEVEDIILEIGMPTNTMEGYREKKQHFFPTVTDTNTEINFDENNILETEKQAREYAKAVIKYAEVDGKMFVEKYHFLPNVSIEIERLEKEGKYWKEFLSGGPDFLFRGLIISKLCNDINFENKLNRVDNYFSDKQWNLDEWKPYYEKLKLKLKTLSPKYNL
jgi:hypothetical protein